MQSAQVMFSALHVANCIGIPGIDIPDTFFDLDSLRERRETAVSPPERARAEQVVRSNEFYDWIQSPTSTQLLVHGNYGGDARVSGLSFLCLSLADGLQQYRGRFIPLVFFCGLHAPSDARTGGHGLIRSLIHQLLELVNWGPGIPMSPDALYAVENGDLVALNWLFAYLVSRIRPGVTVCCLVDGASHYEYEEFWGGVQFVLGPLLQLSRQPSTRHASLKLLITSPDLTSHLWEWFPEDLILSIERRGWADTEPSTLRLERELAYAIQQSQRSSNSPEP